jgi:hypothetical protein
MFTKVKESKLVVGKKALCVLLEIACYILAT